MDQIDFEIIALLQKDASIARKALAYELSISEPTLSKRINNLVEEGVINHFSIDVNYSKIGYDVSAITFIKQKERSHMEELGRHLSTYADAMKVYRITGDWDYAVIWLCKGNSELDDNITKLLKQSELVRDIETQIFLKEITKNVN